MKVTIVVPTRRRPDLLRSALLSMQNQRRPGLIAEVLVSENSEDGHSEAVCRSFQDLPIRSLRQDPVKGIAGHFKWLEGMCLQNGWPGWRMTTCGGKYHLEEDSRLLGLHAEGVAYAGECVTILNDSRSAIHGLRATFYSFQGDTATIYKPD